MKRVMVRLDEGDYSRLKKRATESGEPAASLIRRFVRQALAVERTPQRQRAIHSAYSDLREWAKRSGIKLDPVAVIHEGRDQRP